jgi:hypothetical protein
MDVTHGTVSFNTDQPIWRNLPVEANLAAPEDTLRITCVGVEQDTGSAEIVV